MSDIRKRTGSKGTTYQFRYPSKATKSGYAYKTFSTMKQARAFLESGKARSAAAAREPSIRTMREAVDEWLRICEKEGLDGREQVTLYTLKNYRYRAGFITTYEWPKALQELLPPDIVAFRSWLLDGRASRSVASKVMSTLHSVLKEMTLRGQMPFNVATGISVNQKTRYREPVTVPSKADILALLRAADRLANADNKQIRQTWERYRPILYLAADSGMRPQEYLAIATADIDDQGVTVNRAIDGGGFKLTVTKTDAGRRYIELSPDVIDMVRHYADNHGIRNDFDLVFPARNGKWLCRKNWQRRGFNAACLEAGLAETIRKDGEEIETPKFRPYDLRHFYASLLIEQNTNLKKLQSLMGHRNIETTFNTYGHLLDRAENAKVKRSGLLDTLH